MPSPIGHALAGAAVAWTADAIDRRPSSARLVAACAVLATVADLDLVMPRYHRSFTHSVTAVAIVFIVAAAVTGQVIRLRAARFGGQARLPDVRDGGHARWRIALICAGAYATHLLLDWLGSDTLPPFGLQALWPFIDRFFVSGLNVFAETERRNPFTGATLIQNLWASAREVAIVAPVAAALWLVRVKALTRFPTEVASRDHAPQ